MAGPLKKVPMGNCTGFLLLKPKWVQKHIPYIFSWHAGMKIQLPQISEMLQINVKLIPLSKEMLPRFDSPLLWCFRQQPTRCQTTKQPNKQQQLNNQQTTRCHQHSWTLWTISSLNEYDQVLIYRLFESTCFIGLKSSQRRSEKVWLRWRRSRWTTPRSTTPGTWPFALSWPRRCPAKIYKSVLNNYNISLLVPRSCWEQWHKGIVCVYWRNIGKTKISNWWSLKLSRWWSTRGLENTTALAAGTLIIWPQFSFWNFKKLSFLILICWPPVCLNSWAARHRGNCKGSSGF